MAVSLEQFVQHLTASGLMSATDISSFQESLPPAQRPPDAETLARALVQARKLTKYQAQVVYQGKVKGLVFGEYVVLDKLGQGGMGVVLKAQHRRMDRIVAVKMISGAALKSPDAVKRFYREVKAAARLEHTNIVAAHDAGEHEGGHYLVMQYVDGKDLGAIVKEKGPLPIARAVDYIIQAARGLQYAHKQGIVHRDIKPANLLVDKEGTVKILDMGLARVAGLVDEGDADRLTASGQVMGTCDYMAPEQAVDTHHADHRADIYALGCTLYRLLTGEVLYKGDTLTKILLAHQLSAIPSLGQVRGDVPPPLDVVFQKMVAKKPEDRQQSMADVIAELEGCLGKRTATSTSLNDEATADLSMDDNLSFLRQQTSPHSKATAAKKKVEELTEATIAHQAAAADTSKQFVGDAKLLGTPRKKKRLMAAVAAGLLGVAAIIALTIVIRIRRPDGTETVMRVPEGTQVTLSTQNDESAKAAAGKLAARAVPPFAKPSMSSSEAAQVQKQWADYLGVPVEHTNSIGMKLMLIPPGEFDMGSSHEEQAWALEEVKKGSEAQSELERVRSEVPRHHVNITKPFYLGTYVVTQGEYKTVMGVNPSSFTTQQANESIFNPPLPDAEIRYRRSLVERVAGSDTNRHPVEMVNWEDATEFCRRLSAISAERGRTYRLPTEAEWEYACRAGTTTRWYCGDDEAGLLEAAWFKPNSYSVTHPVGQKKPNAWGLHDMLGNVWQWCSDHFAPRYYALSPAIDPQGPSSGDRITRGGSMYFTSLLCRTAFRSHNGRNLHTAEQGFRVVCEIAPKEQTTTPATVTYALNAPPPALAPFDVAKAKQHQEAWTTYLGVPVEQTNSIGMKLVLVPPGEFDMGSTPEQIAWALQEGRNKYPPDTHYLACVPTELPRHRVKITKAFFLGVYSVTQGEYEKVMGVNPSDFTTKQMRGADFKPPLSEADMNGRRADAKKVVGQNTGNHPVEMVSWNDCVEFCRRLSALPAEQTAGYVYQLPTEAEWEYACRAGTTTLWYCGDDEAGSADVAWFNKNSDAMTHPAGRKKPNAWGLYDMHGNAWQWCSDCFRSDYFTSSPATDPTGPAAGSTRVLRGGGWNDNPSYCRSAFRHGYGPASRSHGLGLRVKVEIGPKAKERQIAVAPTLYALKAPPPAIAPFDTAKARQHQESWAKHLGIPVEQTNSIGMKLALIPPGEFDMGSTPDEIAWALEAGKNNKDYLDRVRTEGPLHRVNITKPFYFGIYQVTQGEYEKVTGVNPSSFTAKQMDASAFTPPLREIDVKKRQAILKGVAGKNTSRHPVDSVNWKDALEFCRTLSALPGEREARRIYRLPTEAEWEYACRAGTTTKWYCGDDETGLTEAAWFNSSAGGMTHPVGEKKPNAWGLFDMHGNVCQWCADWFGEDYYQQSPPNDPLGPSAAFKHVLRGGSMNTVPSTCRSAYRTFASADRSPYNGFRVVCEIAPNEQAAWQNAIDVMPLIDPQKDAEGGTWTIDRGELFGRTSLSVLGRIGIPFQTPQEYDYRIQFTRQAGKGAVWQILTGGGRAFDWCLACKDGKRFGFESINGKYAFANPSCAAMEHNLDNGRRYESLVEVRNDGVKAYLDGKLIAQWKTDYRDLSLASGLSLHAGQFLGVGAHDSSIVFHRIEIREVTGQGQFTRGAAKVRAIDPAFIKEVAALPAEEQVKRVVAKLKELNPGYDGKEGHKIENAQVVELGLKSNAIRDISPVRALDKLKYLHCRGVDARAKCPLADLTPLEGLHLAQLDCCLSDVADLSPLRGMPLTNLTCWDTKVADLRPLEGMSLSMVIIDKTEVNDLSPLRGIALADLECFSTKVKDLSPIERAPLKELRCNFDPKRDTDILRSIKTLEKVNGLPVAEFWKQVEAGKIPSPTTGLGTKPSPVTGVGARPTIDDAFIKEVAALPAEQQVARVIAKLKELNPGYDGTEEHRIESGRVTMLRITSGAVKDLFPVRALAGLEDFWCSTGHATSRGLLADLSPLRGLRLMFFGCGHNEVSDLSPLKGMPLRALNIADVRVSDLSPLLGTPLQHLDIPDCPIRDLEPIRGAHLSSLVCYNSRVSDLSPLAGAPLHTVYIHRTSVSDLSPLRGMPLTRFSCEHTNVKDLSPIKDAPLKQLNCDFNPKRDLEIVRSIKTLEKINGLPVAEFWKQVEVGKIPSPTGDAGKPTIDDAFIKEVAALPAEEQIKRVVAKLKELNPGYDGQEEHRVEMGKVAELLLENTTIKDISPVRALRNLARFNCNGLSRRNRSPLSDLTPLQGLPLSLLHFTNSKVADLSPLRDMALKFLVCESTEVTDLKALHGMPLTSIDLSNTVVSDLSPLRGVPLTGLVCRSTRVTDLSPLKDTPLKELWWDFVPKRDTEILRSIKTLKKINGLPVAEFWKEVSGGKVPSPATGMGKPPAVDPAFLKEVAALPAEQQVARIIAKLKELNPGFDGLEKHKIESGQVIELEFWTTDVKDISPVRALTSLETLICRARRDAGQDRLADLSPLKGLRLKSLNCFETFVSDFAPLEGMPLTKLDCSLTRVVGLTPLRGMPLKRLICYGTKVSDLSPLAGAPLSELTFFSTSVSDLSPLKGMPLRRLAIWKTKVSDLSPLQGMQLDDLAINSTSVSDLAPLRGMPLRVLMCQATKITDLSPLKDTPLKYLTCDFDPKRDTDILRSIKTLEKINDVPVAEFWKKVAAGKIPLPSTGVGR